jgi:hypothetical protein
MNPWYSQPRLWLGLIALINAMVLSGSALRVYGAENEAPDSPMLLIEFSLEEGGDQPHGQSRVFVHEGVQLDAETTLSTTQTTTEALQRYTIAGIVQDDRGQAMTEATLTARGSGSNFAFDRTGADGRYLLSVAADTYQVRASKSGYLAPEQSIMAPPDQEGVNFVMAQCAVDNSTPGALCFHWQGQTSFARPVAFDLAADETAVHNFKLETSFDTGVCRGTLTITVLTPMPIADERFNTSGRFATAGQLTGPNTASGTYAFTNYTIPNCGSFSSSGRWDASGLRRGEMTTPLIVSQPADTTIRAGETATLVVTATVTSLLSDANRTVDQLSWQWYEGATGDVSRPIAGAVEQQFTTPILNANTSYWVRVTHASGGYADSQAALMTVVTHFGLTAPATVEAFVPFSVTVAALDSDGNIATGYRGIVQLESTDGLAQLPPPHLFTADDQGGAQMTVTLRSRGAYQLIARDTTVPVITATAAMEVQPFSGEKMILTLWIVR